MANSTQPWQQPVNVVLGDAGIIAARGRAPLASDSEDERIEAHLLHVAKILRSNTAGTGPEEVSPLREACLSRLEAYAREQNFPRHALPPLARGPIFVDHRGTPCAVADLMRTFGGGHLCSAVDAAHHDCLFAEILEEADYATLQELQAWCSRTGLAADDLAMIQPAYSASDQKKIMNLVNIGMFCTVASLTTGGGGLALLLAEWPSPGFVETLLVSMASIHLILAIVTVFIVDPPPWPGPNAPVSLAYGCVFAPINLVLLSVRTFLRNGNGSRYEFWIITITWGLQLVAMVTSVAGYVMYKPKDLSKRSYSQPEDSDKDSDESNTEKTSASNACARG